MLSENVTMKEMVTLTKKEQRRLMVLNGVEMGRITTREASEVLGLSLRHVRRILAAYRREGAAALAHGNRGRKPHNALDDGLQRRVLELAQSTYAGCNTQHFTELLAERDGIAVSRSAVRLILLRAGSRSPRKRRPPKDRKTTRVTFSLDNNYRAQNCLTVQGRCYKMNSA